MVDVNLKFGTPLRIEHPVDLRFGDAAVTPVGESNVTIAVTLAPPKMSAQVERVHIATLVVTISPPKMICVVRYDNAVYRGPGHDVATPWQVASVKGVSTQDKTQSITHFNQSSQSVLQNAKPLSSGSVLGFRAGVGKSRTTCGQWEDSVHIESQSGTSFSDLLKTMRPQRVAKYADGVLTTRASSTRWQERLRRPRPVNVSRWTKAYRTNAQHQSYSGKGTALNKSRSSLWSGGVRPQPGHHQPSVLPPLKPPCYTPEKGQQVHLRFVETFSNSTDLRFSCGLGISPPASIVIPIKKAYIVLNDVHLKKLDGNVELPVIDLSLQIDRDSWTWGFRATLPKESLQHVIPNAIKDPVELVATINGRQYRLLAESIKRNREFGKTTIMVSGRGKSALLADPYSPSLSFSNEHDRTAQQLMSDALTMNGVSLGWQIDWRIDDWLVPAGTWSHQGSYMSAVMAIANAAGAFIQPDPVEKILRVRPRYPVAPWDLAGATPDIELPIDVIQTESIDWFEKPAYNAVFVSGTTQGGILGHVKRAGTAGDFAAPMQTESLITHAVAARQLGLSILAATGRGATYSLTLPVLPETGIIEPGALIRYVDGAATITGIVKGVSMSASMPSMRQSIEVETYA
ncbi:hypothetical protein BH11PSE12_BH11PSE12_08210 [soil metagenome]